MLQTKPRQPVQRLRPVPDFGQAIAIGTGTGVSIALPAYFREEPWR